jgi:hypothetical protein
MAVMSGAPYGVNTIEVNGSAMLLTSTGGGVAIHLTRAADSSASGREAVPDFCFKSDHQSRGSALSHYDRSALLEPRWSETTLCGREWAIMVGGDGGDVSGFGEVAFAPTCRRCLRLIDRYFPKPAVDPRLQLVAQLAADIVVDQRGFAEIHDVPGDQQEELRKAVRNLVRKRTGQPVRTHSIRGTIHVICAAICDEHAEESLREAAEAMGAFLTNEPRPPLQRDWVVSWATWDLG